MNRRMYLLAIVIVLLVYVLPLGVRPLGIPDETRYGEIPREMLASGDWVVPRLDGLRYFEKPVLGYWLTAASMALFGENGFAVRFPSAAAAAISALAIVFLVRKHAAGGAPPAGLAAVVFLTCPLVIGIGVFAVLDGPFSMFITLAMALFFHGYMATDPTRKALFFAAFGVLSGLAFLTKGLLGFALPVIVIVPFMLWERRLRELFRFPWMPLCLAILVLLPWGIMIHLRERDFWNYFVWVEHFRRFLAPVGKSQHPEPFWYFLPVLVGGALPWMFFVPAAAGGIRRVGAKNPLVRFCICWFGVLFLFFSCSQGKLGTYILPCFAPLSVLVAMGLVRYLDTGVTRLFRGGAFALAALLFVLGVFVMAWQVLPLPPDWSGYTADEAGKQAVGAFGMFVWAALAVAAARATPVDRGLALLCAASVVLLVSLPFVVPTAALEGTAPGKLLVRNSSRIRPESIVACSPNLVGAVCWYYRRADVYLAGSSGECAYGLNYEDSRHRYLSFDDIRGGAYPQGRRLTVVMKTDTYESSKSDLPQPVYVDKTSDFVFLEF